MRKEPMSLARTYRWTLMLAAGIALAPATGHASCSVTEADKDGNGTVDLRLVGDASKQNAIVEMRQAGYLAKVDCNGNGSYTDGGDIVKSGSATIETYSIELAGGDVISVLQTEDLSGASKNVVLTLGAGGNKVTFATQGFGLLAGSNLGIEFLGSTAAENVTLDFTGSTIASSAVFIRGDVSSGNDTVKIIGAANTTFSVVDAVVNLGSENNNFFYIDGGGAITGSTLNVHAEGGDVTSQYDVFNTTFSGQIQDGSRVYVDLNLRAGNDRYFGNFDISSFGVDPLSSGSSEAFFRARGGTGADQMTVSDMSKVGPATVNGLLSVSLDGGNQADKMTLTWNGLKGSGQLRVLEDGGVAYDSAKATIVTDASSTNDFDVNLQGGAENDLGSPGGDTVILSLTDQGAATYGVTGAAVLDGGLDGIDTCTFTGTGIRQAMNCEAGIF